MEFLIVDQPAGLSQFLTSYLHQHNHTYVVLDESGTVEWLRFNHCEVALVDLHMPSKNGLRVVATIRDRENKAPVIALSRHSWPDEHVDAAMCVGANGYVCRTLPTEQLYGVLLRALAKARFEARRGHSRRELLGAA